MQVDVFTLGVVFIRVKVAGVLKDAFPYSGCFLRFGQSQSDNRYRGLILTAERRHLAAFTGIEGIGEYFFHIEPEMGCNTRSVGDLGREGGG